MMSVGRSTVGGKKNIKARVMRLLSTKYPEHASIAKKGVYKVTKTDEKCGRYKCRIKKMA